jgi:hypothetical protein|uniref:Uncharacterized protein n=1 Tax=Caudovirales sp. ctIZM3 TaxID=2827633 RepID=A0A8S5T800_9CAUD|nr:MAG TPA: hypothetical protein [Caudovirales sp. ctIZM3]
MKLAVKVGLGIIAAILFVYAMYAAVVLGGLYLLMKLFF